MKARNKNNCITALISEEQVRRPSVVDSKKQTLDPAHRPLSPTFPRRPPYNIPFLKERRPTRRNRLRMRTFAIPCSSVTCHVPSESVPHFKGYVGYVEPGTSVARDTHIDTYVQRKTLRREKIKNNGKRVDDARTQKHAHTPARKGKRQRGQGASAVCGGRSGSERRLIQLINVMPLLLPTERKR